MEIYLLRHGIAESAAAGAPDSSRELTADGRDRLSAVMKRANHADIAPSLILSSPYVRAHQTAKIAARELGYKGEVELTESLAPHGTPEGVWATIRDHQAERSILLAGHEPLLSSLVAHLLNTPSLRVDMKKAALVRIDVEGIRATPHGVLRWMLVPKLA